jgi:protein-S-isoprenylcysteine O-methyltransferase Ste14
LDLKQQRLQSLQSAARRQFGDYLLFAVTAAELTILIRLTPTFTIAEWIYVLQHVMVLGIALTRPPPAVQDRSLSAAIAVCVAYAYPYAQVIYLRWAPAEPVLPWTGLVLVLLSACLSLAALVSLGRMFGVRPALRGLITKGPYRIVRHPMYLAYVLSDIGYNLQGWNTGTALMVTAGWASLLYRISAEERVLSNDAGWLSYAARVRHRLIPGLW